MLPDLAPTQAPAPYEFLVLPSHLKWRFVEARFRALLDKLDLPASDIETGLGKIKRIVECLDRRFYPEGGQRRIIIIGSWGKGTTARPKGDIDILYELPLLLRLTYSSRSGNIQSQILQDVRGTLLQTFPTSRIKGDGPVVVVDQVGYKVEVLPAFWFSPDSFEVPVTKDGGRYDVVYPKQELNLLEAHDRLANYKLRPLIRMVKHWARVKNTPLKGVHLELLAGEFLQSWAHRKETLFYADWMVRDFFRFLLDYPSDILVIPSSRKQIPLPTGWLRKAEAAHDAAYRACEYEHANMCAPAGRAWQEIFGSWIPIS